MILLPNDIIYNIVFMLDFKSILSLTEVDKNMNILLDNEFFNNLAILYYSEDFWMKASLRPKHISKPLKNMKLEIIRIERFQEILEKLENKRWNNDNFYRYWTM